mgnify:CR=1 FL=1|tara:strand:- start:3080 stop:4567 length:1488 start_codon:yes stop_codon:yes gene_type:complete
MDTCHVCCEEFDLKKRKAIVCKCDFKVCLVCFETYQGEHSGLYEVQCMNCKTPLCDDFLHSHLSKSILKRLKEVTKKRLRDEEMAFMPETCLYVQYDRDVETKKIKEYYQLSKEYEELNDEIRKMCIQKNKKQTFRDEIRKKKRLSEEKKYDIQRLEMRILNWRQSMIMSRFFMDIVPDELKSKVLNDNRIRREPIKYNTNIVCKCSNGECKGFITKPIYECVLCQYKICSKCLTEKTDNHECTEENLKNADFILSTSKPCPTCATFIHKIEGCDQMWCTQCNTAFSWRTAEILNHSTIHNPHYYEWMRTRQNHDVDRFQDWNNCEGLPEYGHVLQHARILYPDWVNRQTRTPNVVTPANRKRLKFLGEVHRICNHIHHVERRVVMERNFRTNLDIRMKWMKNEITDKNYEMVLHRRYKQRVVDLRIAQVNQTIWTICADIFHRFLRNVDPSAEIFDGFKKEFIEAFKYGNVCFTNLSLIYNVTMPYKAFDWMQE